ncbi:MAG: prepilin-type N-terminal cleavage/methylation domain-containing protein [Rhodocyclales bacterium]|nr:prepilin-type N-terminal cleavage/methylation domain-containing protein [Rhodocyclales bacterium]
MGASGLIGCASGQRSGCSPLPGLRAWERAFTLIELLVTLAIIGLLLSLVAPRYFSSVTRAEETALKHNLALLREAVDKHYADTGKYPVSLEDLVRKKYIRSVPVDPVTESGATWVLVPPDDPDKGGIYDVRSGAQGVARDGSQYNRW